MSLTKELRRRNVLKVAALYGVASWVILQVADVVLPAVRAPDWGISLILGLLAFGLPVALFLAWKYELTPEGIRREEQVDADASISAETGRRIYLLIGILASVAVIVMIAGQLMAPDDSTLAPSTDAATSGRIAGERFLNTAPVTSVAVLPFVNMSGDPEHEFFSDGLSEELLHALAGVQGLSVPARTSSFRFKGDNADIAEIGRQLNVRHVLEGSVRWAGERVRVTAQLIDVTNGYHLWSQRFDRRLDDIFAIQDEIAERVTTALEVTLVEVAPRSEEPPTENMNAYLAYLRGLELIADGGVEGYKQAVSAFEEAVELDPDFAEAHAQLGLALAHRVAWGHATREETAMRIKEAADKALALNDSLAVAWVANALASNYVLGNIPGNDHALESFERAYALAPNDFTVVSWYAFVLKTTHRRDLPGHREKALAMLDRALELDPLSVDFHVELGYARFFSGDRHAAAAHFQRAVEIAPDNPAGMHGMVDISHMSGEIDQAVLWAGRALAADPENPHRWLIAVLYLELDDIDQAHRWLEVAERGPAMYLNHFAAAMIAWYEGDGEEAARQAEIFLANQEFLTGHVDFMRWIVLEQSLATKPAADVLAAKMRGQPFVTEFGTPLDVGRMLFQTEALPALRRADPARADQATQAMLDITWLEAHQEEFESEIDLYTIQCHAYAQLERVEEAVDACRKEFEIINQYQLMLWRTESIFEPVRDDPRWQALIDEVANQRAQQLADLRSSGEAPIPGARLAIGVADRDP